MTREEMIEILVEDRFWEWIYARNTDGLADTLKAGFIGYEDYTDEQLAEALEEMGDRVDEVKEMLKNQSEYSE